MLEAEEELTCDPLETLEQILSWDPKNCKKWSVRPLEPRMELVSQGESRFCHKASVDWKPAKLFYRNTVPKTPVCHDMMGGYLNDKYVFGSDKPSDYKFFHWAGIDIFVYFSHKLLTIPPPVWVNAAHLHGVLVLGTLITEWDDGREVLQRLLRGGEGALQKFASQIGLISECYGIDGWLVNIENSLQRNYIPMLKRLLSILTNTLHKRIPHSKVIWYDSIIPTGQLLWQSELNQHNRVFFDLCDGIFLDYKWREQNLFRTVLEAGERALDVYVGVDVFGRGCKGGGGFNTREAVQAIRSHNLSVAIFAPGWVYEKRGVEDFTLREYKFWRLLWPFLYIHGPTQLPYETSFCQGYGLRRYLNGKIVAEEAWHNLSEQQPQPCVPSCGANLEQAALRGVEAHRDSKIVRLGQAVCCIATVLTNSQHVEEGKGCVQHHAGDAFLGGACLLLLRPDFIETIHPIMHRLLLCSFDVKHSLLVSFALKSQVTDPEVVDPDLHVWLMCQDKSTNIYRSECLGDANIKDGRQRLDTAAIESLKTRSSDLSRQLSVHPENDWKVWHFLIPAAAKSYFVNEVCVSLGYATEQALLGWLAITEFQQK